MSMKFFIFAGGRWREVDMETGGVSGWRNRAQFAYQSRGKLRVASSESVLRGVRALADGHPSSVQDGPRLSQMRCENSEYKKIIERETMCLPYCQYRCKCIEHKKLEKRERMCLPCCQQGYKRNTIQPISPLLVSNYTQTSHQEVTLNLLSETEHRARPVARMRAQSCSKQISVKRKHVPTSSDSTENGRKIPKIEGSNLCSYARLAPKKNQLKSQRDNSKTAHVVDKSKCMKLQQKSTRQSCRTTTEEFTAKITSRSNDQLTDDAHSEEQSNDPETVGRHIASILTRNSRRKASKIDACKELIIDQSDVELFRNYLRKHCSDDVVTQFDNDQTYKTLLFYRINPLVSVERCERIHRMLQRADNLSLVDFASQLGLRSVSEGSQENLKRYKTRNNIRTPHKDVWTKSETDNFTDLKQSKSIRNLTERILRGATSERNNNVLHHPDTCNNDQSSRTTRNSAGMLRTDRESSGRVNKLDRDSNSKVVSRDNRGRYRCIVNKLKRNRDTACVNKLDNQYNSEGEDNMVRKTHSEGANRDRNSGGANKLDRARNSDKVTKFDSDRHSKGVHKLDPNRSGGEENRLDRRRDRDKSKHKSNVVVSVSSDSESQFQSKQEAPRKVDALNPHIISKRPCRPSAKEYSTLEDHAIVSWLSLGSRSRQVKGNRVWRDLQDSYLAITGTKRTWHSLRNRYLRYILPSLSQLGLPHSLTQRLRAAAAAGSLKSRNLPQRRNSLFEGPEVRGAWSRRPAPTAVAEKSSSPSPPPPGPASPRSSSPRAPRRSLRLTSPSPERTSSRVTSRASPSPPTRRTRKLFNHNVAL
ncbi:uncharacterized protein LOC101737398 [Bombyx mori]|uniref:TERF2-interacting telomeric protein 1 Myb domain-containing protein n=1 Tax=Bombyx mori TaxID=7091 RepID=A0A8R2M799_BOMMO|nr:uncharacterized protein LOC101737398 [Bombyx mori]